MIRPWHHPVSTALLDLVENSSSCSQKKDARKKIKYGNTRGAASQKIASRGRNGNHQRQANPCQPDQYVNTLFKITFVHQPF